MSYGTGTYGSGFYGGGVGPAIVPAAITATSGVTATVAKAGAVAVPTFPNVIAEAAFANNPGDAILSWSDLSARLRSFKTQRGRNMELDEIETGMATPDLDNRDRAIDPSNASGPYYPNIKPVRPFRLRATVNSVTYSLFKGDAEDWPQIWDPNTRDNHSEFNVLDAFDALKDVDIPTTFTRPVELSGTRIVAILDAAGWPTGQRVIDTGQSFIQAETLVDGTRKALEMLQEIAVTENGLVFIDASGNFVFQDRHRRIKPPYNTSQVTLSNVPAGGELPFAEAKLEDGKALIKNDIYVEVVGGDTANAQDANSIQSFRQRSYSVTTRLNDPNEAILKANWLLGIYKDAQYRVPWVKIAPQLDSTLWQHALGRDIGDRITVKVYPPGGGAVIQQQSTIERIEHEVTKGNWETTWYLSPADASLYWLLGTSQLGVDTRLAY